MPGILQKKFYHCFPNFKCLPTNLSLSFEEEENEQTIKNFNSVFDIPSDSATSKSLTNSSTLTEDYIFSSFEDSEYSDTDSNNIPDFSNVFASQRFFFTSPGNSNSIVDFPTTPSPEKREEAVVNGGVAIQTYSPDPYSDFRRSMQEMVEAHELTDVKANWELLHELLLCYLNLNPKHTHKYIVGAFSDLVVSLMTSSSDQEKRRKVQLNGEQSTILL
ncbi:transcription repressor OFP16-like [Nicotiana tabacum]|uniref:Transcription repressor n=2 Tax=Nicotiana TaxID=4085 RepID=A0A1S4ATT3_TOBAC|nr:PREDICTED: transcription repressor OFP12-like [Nicotiana sylvestris]XP_016479913.1 PREDICTED: transcription repressor OFP12-like [Nicotiana tabacum]